MKRLPIYNNNFKNESCTTCEKKKCSLISGLNFDELSALDEKKYKAKFKAGELIFKEGTKPVALMALNSGKVKITKMGELGHELIITLKKPVNFLGFKALMSEDLYSSNAIALEDSEVCYLDKADFFEIIDNNSSLSAKIIRHFADELNQAQKRILSLTQKHLRGRMAEALLFVEDIYGTSPIDASLNVLLKRADYASLSNMTTPNAIRTISAFAKEGLIHVKNRKITILKKKQLDTISLLG